MTSFDSLLQSELQVTQGCALLVQQATNKSGRTAIISGTNVNANLDSRLDTATAHELLSRQVRTIQQRLKELESELDDLRRQAEDAPELIESEQSERMKRIEQHAAIIQDLHGTLRTAILRARAQIERDAIQARQELIGSNDPAALKRRQTELAAQTAAEKSNQLTHSLHRTRNMLSNEIARSSAALDTLTSSTRVLGSTSAEYHTYGKTVKIGSKIITKQLQRERTDKILIAVGLCFFALVVCYIINKRLTPFLFWWTHFFMAKTPAVQVDTSASTSTASPADQIYYQPTTTNQGPATYIPTTTNAPSTHQIPYTPTPDPITPSTSSHPLPSSDQQLPASPGIPDSSLSYAEQQARFLQHQQLEQERQARYIADTIHQKENQLYHPEPMGEVHQTLPQTTQNHHPSSSQSIPTTAHRQVNSNNKPYGSTSHQHAEL